MQSFILSFIIIALQWRHNEPDVGPKSPVSRLFTQPFIQAQMKENIKAPRHRWPVNSPHKWPVTRKMFPFDDVIMEFNMTF